MTEKGESKVAIIILTIILEYHVILKRKEDVYYTDNSR